MTTMSRYIRDMKRLEKRIIIWDAVATLTGRINRYARAKYCEYVCEQEDIIHELNVGSDDYMDEVRKEYNRQNFRIETDL